MSNFDNKELITISKNPFKKMMDKIKKIFIKENKETILPNGNKNQKELNVITNLSEKLTSLQNESKELEEKLKEKIDALKKVRIKELELTLKIYQIEEIYLKNLLNIKKSEI